MGDEPVSNSADVFTLITEKKSLGVPFTMAFLPHLHLGVPSRAISSQPVEQPVHRRTPDAADPLFDDRLHPAAVCILPPMH